MWRLHTDRAENAGGVCEVVGANTCHPRTLRQTDAGDDTGLARELQRIPQNRAAHVPGYGRQTDLQTPRQGS